MSVDAAQGTGAGREPRGRSACELRGIVVTPAQRIADGAVRWEGDSLTYVGPRQGKPAAAAEPSDLPYIVPGFVDLHVHGGGGRDTMEGSDDALAEISKTHLQGGTTSLLATTLTAPIEQIEEALEAVEQCIQERQAETTVVGAHIEGPYFNASQAGAQNSEHLREPASTDYLPLLERFSCIRRFSAAPELKGALALGRELRRRGVLASIAHTDATYTQVRRAIEAGYSHVTHIYSAMSSVRRRNAYRIAGVVEAALLEESLSVEVIADGHHLPPSLLRLVIRCKGPGKVCAVTDAISAAGLGPGSYQLGGLDVVVDGEVIDDYECILPAGSYVAKLADRSAFAGSTALMNGMVRNLVLLAGVPLEEAVSMVTSTPCRLMGWEDRGVLAPGRRADIVVLDQGFEVREVIVGGKIAYQA